jgi:hypothetical protein
MGHRTRNAFASLLPAIVGVALAGADSPRLPLPAPSPAAKPAPVLTGQLNIEGTGIERIVLERRFESGTIRVFDPNDTVVLNRPGKSESVRAGDYWVQEVELQGGYSCMLPRRTIDGLTGDERVGDWVRISSEKPCSLKIGGPLKSTVITHRMGRTVQIAYRIVDADGRMYYRRSAQTPPRFTIRREGRQIGSGSFEYG